MAGLKSQLFRSGLSALWFSGVARALEPWTAGCGAILMLHRIRPASLHGQFTPNAQLTITPEYLDALLVSFRNAGVDIVTLDEAMRRIEAAEHARRFVCFTFDDGYRDNLEHALPAFARHGAPFTVYATSSFVDRSFAPWWYLLEDVIARNAHVRWATGTEQTVLDTSDVHGKYQAFALLSDAFFKLPVAAVRVQLSRLAQDHDTSIRDFGEREMCNLAELQALRAGGAEIGCHTVSHALLMRESAEVVRDELLTARTTLEAWLGCPVKHLAFPYGKRDHVGPRELTIAKELGFATATTTRKGALFPIHAQHRHALPRVEVTPAFEASPRYLQTILSGLPLLLWNSGQRAIVD